MGTRSLTKVFNDERLLVVMYRQMDGYPSGHGLELARFLTGMTIINGLGGNVKKAANGMGCLAAQIVAHFKEGVGGIYLMPMVKGDHGQDYEYEIHLDKLTNELLIKVADSEEADYVFTGNVEAFLKFCKSAE